MCVSGGRIGAMVTMTHLSAEDPDDGSPLLPEAVEAATPTPVFHRQQAVTKTDSRDFFLSRYISAGAIINIMGLLFNAIRQQPLLSFFSAAQE